jgi:hypothetical protein
MEKYFYIYNLKQANFFIKNKIIPIELGKSNSDIVYVKFLRNEEADRIFTQWCYMNKN